MTLPPRWEFRSVVFDLDGLLIDTEPIFEEAARRLLAERGLASDPLVIRAMMGMPARDALGLFRAHHGLPETVAELAAESSRLFYEVLGEQPVPLLPGGRELLESLERRGIPRALATSSSARYVTRILAPHGLLRYFAQVLTCDDVTHGKPHPEIYEKAAERLGHAPALIVVLEDSPNGVRAARAAGARCVAVPHLLTPRDDVRAADAIVRSLDDPELLALLGIGH
jgi:HAD superfamily hydrolase (TIGR01509 family)